MPISRSRVMSTTAGSSCSARSTATPCHSGLTLPYSGTSTPARGSAGTSLRWTPPSDGHQRLYRRRRQSGGRGRVRSLGRRNRAVGQPGVLRQADWHPRDGRRASGGPTGPVHRRRRLADRHGVAVEAATGGQPRLGHDGRVPPARHRIGRCRPSETVTPCVSPTAVVFCALTHHLVRYSRRLSCVRWAS